MPLSSSSPLPSTPTAPASSSPPPARSPFPPPLRLPRPLGTDAPATCAVPQFPPVRVGGGRYQVQRLLRHRRRAIAAGLAVTAAALVTAGPRTAPEPHHTERARGLRGR
ncbi:hypothetical protein ACLU3S_16450, partial [Streptomyces sp. AF1A]